MSKLKKLLFKICYTPLRGLPAAQIFNYLRGWVVGQFLKKAGPRLRIYNNVSISNPQNISIGRDVVINPGCFLITSAGNPEEISIGDDCLLAPRCFLETLNHTFVDPYKAIRLQGHSAAPIAIGNDCWLGYGVVVLPGKSIGDGAVVGAYALVNKDIEPYTVNVGNPARQIRKRDGQGS